MKAISMKFLKGTVSLMTSRMKLSMMENSIRVKLKAKESLHTITIITHTKASSALTQDQPLESWLSANKKTPASPSQSISTITRLSRPESSIKMEESIRVI